MGTRTVLVESVLNLHISLKLFILTNANWNCDDISKNSRTIHLFICDHFTELKDLLIEFEQITKFDPTNKKVHLGVNYWIIHVSGKENKEILSQVLSTSPLRLDSHLLEFYEENKGKLSCPNDTSYISKKTLNKDLKINIANM